ncbi:MAG: hypothetical protein ACOC44_16560, partial [Promethearchaeia archaeon]
PDCGNTPRRIQNPSEYGTSANSPPQGKESSTNHDKLKVKCHNSPSLPSASDFTTFKKHTREILRDLRFLCERLREKRKSRKR